MPREVKLYGQLTEAPTEPARSVGAIASLLGLSYAFIVFHFHQNSVQLLLFLGFLC